jgi:hypothetical protein
MTPALLPLLPCTAGLFCLFSPAGEKQVEIADLPDWAQPAFKGMKSLNRVQSKVSDCALYSSENMLVCAPTGEAAAAHRAWGCSCVVGVLA